MEHNAKKRFENVGEEIPKSLRDYLVDGFMQREPNRQNTYFISANIINEILADTKISGIRFKYAILEPSSKKIDLILVPCGYEAPYEDDILPNFLLVQEGYRLHDGSKISLNNCFHALFNYVRMMHAAFPNVSMRQINRGAFVGRSTLESLIRQTKHDSIKYELGYAIEETELLVSKHHPVLSALDTKGNSIIYFDRICPSGGWSHTECTIEDAFTRIDLSNSSVDLNSLRNFRQNLWTSDKGHLVEKYYYLNPIVVSKLKNKENKGLIMHDFANNALKPCLLAIDNNASEETVLKYYKKFEDLVEQL